MQEHRGPGSLPVTDGEWAGWSVSAGDPFNDHAGPFYHRTAAEGTEICGMRVAARARDKLGRLIGTGVTAMVFAHVFVNIAMTIGAMPVTGIPLPLVSYGGSFMLCTMASLGLLQSVYVRRL